MKASKPLHVTQVNALGVSHSVMSHERRGMLERRESSFWLPFSRIPNLSYAGVPSLDCRSSTRKSFKAGDAAIFGLLARKFCSQSELEDCGLSRSPHSLTWLNSLTSLLRALRSLVRSARVHNLQVSIAYSKIRAKRPMIVASPLSPVDSSFLAEAARSTRFCFESASLWTIHSREGTPT